MARQHCKSIQYINLNGLKTLLNLMKILKNYYEESDEGHFLEVDVQYPQNLYEFHNDLPFLLERIKIEKF